MCWTGESVAIARDITGEAEGPHNAGLGSVQTFRKLCG